MKKTLSFLTLAAILLVLAPGVEATDLYANSLVSASPVNVIAPQNSVGAPDQIYTDFRDKDTYIKLDMGEGEAGQDGLRLYILPLEFGAATWVTFYSESDVMLDSDNGVFGVGATTWTATCQCAEPFRYVKIESREIDQWRLDAVQATAITAVDDQVPVDEEPIDEPVEEVSLQSNDLIKLATDSAVYVLGEDGKRHPFPNETTFSSWDYSFDDVVTVDAETMASYLIGGSVTIKPGSYLVKIQSVPKVYTVAPNHTLRWITSEELAIELYGVEWAKQVVDVSDALWPRYTEGEPINSAADLEGWETETQPY